jgi:tripartite-type tricarboxylate transporter receptor subunit TctC
MNRFIRYSAIGALAAGIFAAAPAAAFDYAGKRITLVIGYGFGGTYGKYARTMADHMRNFIPGRPTIIVQSMPGAGGIKMTNFAGSVMAGNGFNIFMPPDTTIVSQLLRPGKVKYDARNFRWLGASNQTNVIYVVRNDTGIKKITDLKTMPVIAGHTGPGSTAYLMPTLTKAMLGYDKLKIIGGYKGSSKTLLAMEQGEITSAAFNWLAWNSIRPQWFEQKTSFATPILQMGVWKDPDLPNIPMLNDMVKGEDKAVVSFMSSLGIIGRGLALPPGTPKEVLDILRPAFAKMVKSDAYKKDAIKRRLRVLVTSGEEIDKFVVQAFKDADEKVVARARKMIFGK